MWDHHLTLVTVFGHGQQGDMITNIILCFKGVSVFPTMRVSFFYLMNEMNEMSWHIQISFSSNFELYAMVLIFLGNLKKKVFAPPRPKCHKKVFAPPRPK